jgi:tellurite resistance protein
MPLADEISAAGLTPAMRRVLARALRGVAAADGPIGEAEERAIRAMLGGDDSLDGAQREPIESIWPHAELCVRACVHLALVDGDYRVEEARAVGQVAHRLGLSAPRLATIERQVFRFLRSVAARRSRTGPPPLR